MSDKTSVPKVFEFGYLYRDQSNYKTRIELQLRNDAGLTLDEARKMLSKAFGVDSLGPGVEFIPEAISMADERCFVPAASESGLYDGFLHEADYLDVSHYSDCDCDFTRFVDAVEEARKNDWYSMEIVTNVISNVIADYGAVLVKSGVAEEKDGMLVIRIPIGTGV